MDASPVDDPVLLSGVIVLCVVGATLVTLNFKPGEKRIQRKLERLFDQRPRLRTRTGRPPGPPVLGGNRYQVLRNGDEIFPALLASIRSARRSIDFETLYLLVGTIGREVADALTERARAGVKVHVLLDWLGSAKMDDALIREMADAGVQVRRYHALRWYELGRLNNRTHESC